MFVDFEKVIAQLKKKAGKEKLLSTSDVEPFAKPGSELYFEIERALLNNDIDIAEDEEYEDVEVKSDALDEDDDFEIEDDEDEPDDLSLSGLEVEEEELINIDTIASSIKIDDP